MKIDELVDRGSELSVMKKRSIYNKLALTKLECTNINQNGFGKSIVRPLGKLVISVLIDEENFDILFYVVPDEIMLSNEMILGSEVLELAEIFISKTGIKIKKSKKSKKIWKY